MAAKSPKARRSARRGGSASSRPTGFYLILAAIAAAGVGGLAFVALRPTDQEVTPPAALPADLESLGPPQPYRMGSPDAPVEILEFADYECPSCARFASITEPDVRSRIIETGRASLAYFDMPLPQHLHSYPASHAAACADEQGRFWEMHDQLYAEQDRWSTGVTRNPRGLFREIARALGLNVGEWEQCYDSRRHQRRIDANAAEAVRRGVNSTPTFIINGKPFRGAMGFDDINAAVRAAEAAPQGADSAP